MAVQCKINWIFLLLILVFAPVVSTRSSLAQSAQPELGDPPMASRIQISEPDENGIVTITGEANAVFPAAQVIVRNLYTNQQTIVPAGITGTFNARLFGPGNTPFWISPAPNVPEDLRTTDQTVPGGPGTIIYGSGDAQQSITEADTLPITTIMLDGISDDWSDYSEIANGESWRGFTNPDSIYLFVGGLDIEAGNRLGIDLTAANISYTLQVDIEQGNLGTLQQIAPVIGDERPDVFPFAFNAETNLLELRINRRLIAQGEGPVQLDRIYTLDGLEPVDEILAGTVLPELEQRDGLLQAEDGLSEQGSTRFTLGGTLGERIWTGDGRIDSLDTIPGDTLTLEIDATLNATRLPDALIGELIWQPVTVPGLYTNNGWSNLRTPSGLAINNVYGDVTVAQAITPVTHIIERDGTLQATLRFDMTLPESLPAGRYVPAFQGFAQFGETLQPWSTAFAEETQTPNKTVALTRLPLVINIGDLAETHLLWTLFYDHPSDGARGILAAEDTDRAALANRVKLNPPSYILPPGDYPLEPYLPSMLPNQYDFSAAPLLPLLLPSGRLTGTITGPDGTTTNLPGAPIVQNQLSSTAIDEREIFGGQSPIDLYRLTTLNPEYTAYTFTEYGPYQIELRGSTEDIYGNVYSGGGSYDLLIAEPLELLTGALPGAPFAVGDSPFIGGHILPGFPADVRVAVTTYDLNGNTNGTDIIEAQANRYGYFHATTDLTFDTPGEYVIDYDVRYEDGEGRLWAASLRSAGVITDPESTLLARGQRGVDGYIPTDAEDGYLPLWFSSANYPPGNDSTIRGYYPYHPGDIARITDGFDGGLVPTINAHDLTNSYQNWLLGTTPQYVSTRGYDLTIEGQLEALPLQPILGGPRLAYGPALEPDLIANQAYAYISAVRPGVSVRQYVTGGTQTTLPLYWDSADPLNQQIGAGADGDEPGDYTFLFGGLVVRNPEAAVATAHGYAAFGIVVDSDAPAQVHPPYRSADGGPDGGPLVRVRGEDFDMLFHPTGVRPGQVLTEGDTLIFAGHVAPTLTSQVSIEVTSPDGETQTLNNTTNPYGYLYDPTLQLTADEAGIWSIEIVTTGIGTSSAGIAQEPFITGGVPGTINRRFNVYVLAENSDPLRWNTDNGDADLALRGGDPFNFSMAIPADWREIEADFTVSTPGYVLDSGEPRIGGASVTYQYNPPQLSSTFPNLETGGEGPAAGDLVTLTFAISGENASGRREIRTRTFTIFFDRLVSFEDLARE